MDTNDTNKKASQLYSRSFVLLCLKVFAGRGNLGAITSSRSAGFQTGFQTCRIADFQIGRTLDVVRLAGLETRDTAGLETCATTSGVLAPQLSQRACRT